MACEKIAGFAVEEVDTLTDLFVPRTLAWSIGTSGMILETTFVNKAGSAVLTDAIALTSTRFESFRGFESAVNALQKTTVFFLLVSPCGLMAFPRQLEKAKGLSLWIFSSQEDLQLLPAGLPALDSLWFGLQHSTNDEIVTQRSHFMIDTTSARASGGGLRGLQANGLRAKSLLTKIATVVEDRNIGFFICSIGMIVMLLWAGRYKMTASGSETISPLVTNSPLTSWLYKVVGPYIGSDMIGATEWVAAFLLIIGFFKPKAGILGGIILVGMYFTTSTMLFTTPNDTIVVNGFHYMNDLGLFLFKDIVSFGATFYLISSYGRKAVIAENQR